MAVLRIDHIIIHVADWERSIRFYQDVLGASVIENEEGRANPLGAWAFRVGDQQVNVHGPWPDQPERCCPPPLNEPGTADLCFEWGGGADSAARRLRRSGAMVTEGPIARFGARGWGTSVYTRDPDGNSIELINYE